MGFLRTILIIVFIYYALKFLGRLLAPFAIKKVMEKMNNQSFHQENKKEGEVTIDKAPEKNTNINNSEGEYVDFEEIKDE